jgi:hypothetical protein
MDDTTYDHMLATRMILSAVDSLQSALKAGVSQV